jgi:dephospho-CoA kinase
MLNVALTGNIAAGKSSVAELFRRWGATVLDADAIVRELQQPGTPVMRRIAERFGHAVVRPDGSLDRPALRRIVMADPDARAALERIVHPAVYARRAELAAEAEARGDRVVVSDIPLLFETGDSVAFDAVVLVDAPEPVRLRRLTEHRGLSEAEAREMIGAQMPASAKRTRSHFVIDNDGDLAALERATAAVWRALAARA